MSMSVLLVPLAVALCVTASETMNSIANKCREPQKCNSLIQTRFNDPDILYQTLDEHGLHVTKVDNMHIVAECSGGSLCYVRNSESDAFSIELRSITDADCLINDLVELETEYDNNVQSFTYHKVIENLPPDMSIIEDTVMEDDSIMLTIAVGA